MSEIDIYISQQNDNRRLWVEEDTPDKIIEMIYAELDELAESIKEAYITGDVFSVASELGDVAYLVHRLGKELGIDVNQATEMKIIRNSMKYSDHVMSNGRDLPSTVAASKDAWKAMGGDPVWSHAYLDHLSSD